jgi:hypothetical protein
MGVSGCRWVSVSLVGGQEEESRNNVRPVSVNLTWIRCGARQADAGVGVAERVGHDVDPLPQQSCLGRKNCR